MRNCHYKYWTMNSNKEALSFPCIIVSQYYVNLCHVCITMTTLQPPQPQSQTPKMEISFINDAVSASSADQKGGLGNLPVTLPRVKLEPSMRTDGFPCNVSLCLISPEETLLKFKKKIQKVGLSNRFGWTTKQTFLRLEQHHSWPCQIKPNHTSKSSHPIFEHLKIWKKKTWFLDFWFHIKLARPSTGWFQGSPPWSRCHIYPRPPQTRQTFSSCSQKKKIWIFEEAKVPRDFLRLPSSGTVDEM